MQQLRLVLSIHRATHRIGLYIQEHVPGNTQAEAHILCHLYEAGDSSIAQLHRAFAHKRSTLTSVLDRLHKRGLVKRSVSPRDRRSFVVSLTAAGRKEAARVHAALEALEKNALKHCHRRALESFDHMFGELERAALAEAATPTSRK
jgi:DNA-binding MarR family transcriptional regulator